MTITWKRAAAIALSLLLVLSMTACTTPSPTQTGGTDVQPTQQPQATEPPADGGSDPAPAGEDDPYADLPLEITVSLLDFGNYPATREGTIEDNNHTKWINENAPVKVTFIPINRGEASTRYATMLAAGAAPDIITEWDIGMFEQFVLNGSLQPLDDVFEKWGPNLKALTPEETLEWGYYNGQLYGIPKIRSETNIVSPMAFVRQDWLDNLNMQMPTNIDEFMEMLRAFTTGDPDKNGENDTWGLGSNGESGQNSPFRMLSVFQDFYGTHNNQWFPLEDGSLEYSDIHPMTLEAVKLYEQIYDEGLCNPEFFTQTAQQSIADWINGRVGVIGNQAHSISASVLESMWEVNPDARISPLKTLETPYGLKGYYKERPVDLINQVPTTCKNPKAVIMYLDWMISQGWEKLNYGNEGEHFERIDGRIIPIGDSTERGQALSPGGMLVPVWNYSRSIEDVEIETQKKRDDGQAQSNIYSGEITIAAMEESLSVPYYWYTPTKLLGLSIVSEKLPTMEQFAENTWQKAIIDKSLSAEDAYEMIKNEWEATGYAEVRKAYNDKAKEMGYID